MTATIQDLISKRRSTRSFTAQPLLAHHLEHIREYTSHLDNLTGPFRSRVALHYLPLPTGWGQGKIGTYGFISQAQAYVAGSCEPEECSLIDLGYIMEGFILEMCRLGLGTCWLAGTFQRAKVVRSLPLPPGHIVPAVTPLGYPSQPGLREKLIRGVVAGDLRKPWEELFFSASTGDPVTMESAGRFSPGLEALRRGPSASNRQPWRASLSDDRIHLYLRPTPGYATLPGFEMQRLDMGIAMYHLERVLTENGIRGVWESRTDFPLRAGEIYICTFLSL